MNVVQICPTPFPSLGGPALNYAQFHRALGTATVCFVRPGEGIGEQMVVPTKMNIRTVDFPFLTKYYYTESSELVTAEAAVKAGDCLIIHNFYRFPAVWGARTAKRHNVPYIVVLHGILDPWVFNKNALLKKIWLRFYGTQILDQAAVVLCATEKERQKIKIFLKKDVGRVVRWAVEIPSLPNAWDREKFRRELGFAPTDRVVLFFGRLDSMKRPLETVRILAEIKDPRLKLLVVGPDADVTGRQLVRSTEKLGWGGLRVIGPCFSVEKYNYLRAADAYISLSHRENFNFTAAEAMLCGLPVILSPGNDLGWEFVNGGFSWQLTSDDPIAAQQAVKVFLDTPEEVRLEQGRLAAQWAKTNLSVARFQERISAVVKECIRKP